MEDDEEQVEVDPPQAPRGSTEEDPSEGKHPIYTVPVIWDTCVLKFMNTEIACKITGSRDPRKPRSCSLADREGMDAVPENAKKWLAGFLAKVPPDTTWGRVQAAPDRGPGPPDPPPPPTPPTSNPLRGGAGPRAWPACLAEDVKRASRAVRLPPKERWRPRDRTQTAVLAALG